jgi:hypothetical protein
MRTKKARGLRWVVLTVLLLLPVWGADTAGAQEHDHPTTTTTRPGATTSTTRPGATTTTTEHDHPTTSTTTPGPTTTTTRPQVPGNPGTRTTKIRYGPWAQQAAVENPDGSHGHWHSGNQFAFNVQKPCTNCYITGMQANLTYPDGTTGGYSTGSQLHHMVLFNRQAGKTDATCDVGFPFPLGALFGQRFFASGDERTFVRFPAGYGYFVGADSNWTLIWDLAGMSRTPKTVYYDVTYNWVPAPANLSNVEPIWFDVAQCGFSTFTAMPGPSTHSWSWTVNRPGDIVALGGHGHDGTIDIDIVNDSTGQLICKSRAGYGESPLYTDPEHGAEHISSMSTCLGTPVARITNGQRVTMNAHYNMAKQDDGQMGIVMAFVGPPRTGGGGGCFRSTNTDHTAAGRAATFLFWSWAVGSGNYLGAPGDTTSLREGPAGTWTKVDAC